MKEIGSIFPLYTASPPALPRREGAGVLNGVSKIFSMGCSVYESAPSLRGKSDVDNILLQVPQWDEFSKAFHISGSLLRAADFK